MSFKASVLVAAVTFLSTAAVAAAPVPLECERCMRTYLDAIGSCTVSSGAETVDADCANVAGRAYTTCSTVQCPDGAPSPYDGRDHWSFLVSGTERCEIFRASFSNPQDGSSYLAGWVNGTMPTESSADATSVDRVVIRMNGREQDLMEPSRPGAGGWIRPVRGGVNTVTLELCRPDDSPLGVFTLMFHERDGR